MQATRFIRALRPHRHHELTGGRTMVRIYERQSQFERDVKRLHRQGWHLESVSRKDRTLPLDIVRSSAPGTILNLPRHRIEARYRYQPVDAANDLAGVVPKRGRFKNVGEKFARGARGTFRRGTTR